MTEIEIEQRQIAMYRNGSFCEVCGKPLTAMQGAHRIANSKANRAKWGSQIIDHPLNIAIVCSLKCNDACTIGNNPGACWQLVKLIAQQESIKFERRG